MSVSRRTFIKYAQAVGLYYAGLASSGCAPASSTTRGIPLVKDPLGMLDLPEGFSYTLVSSTGDKMSDGFFRPGRPDGMACFPFPGDVTKCILMRNHENWPDTETAGPFGKDNTLATALDASQLYDRKADGDPFLGGVTKVVYDLKNKRLEKDLLVLAGTTGNCAGGATPWGSWLSCEESSITPNDGAGRYHGFAFEIPSSADGLIDPVPLVSMGRFAHEAAAVDPATGIVYLTEDNRTGLFYRFLPDVNGELVKGGRLQALAIKGWASVNTSNWARDWGGQGFGSVAMGQQFEVEWIDMDDVEAPGGDLAARGHAAGAAQFCRGEGIDYGARPGDGMGEIFFNCTQGGAQRTGQVWRYTPSDAEGGSGEVASPGKLTLLYESPGADTLDNCDNLKVAPWGDLILCEDGPGDQFLRGLTPGAEIYDLARNAHEGKSEFCGACFSPDGSVMFVNIQEPGFTLAIEGPWASLRV